MSKTKKILDLSLMIPVFNEEDCLQETVIDLIKDLRKTKIDFELVLLNNGSTDSTSEIMEKLKKQFPKNIRIISFRQNKKLGRAINYVTSKHLNGKIIGFTCADGEVTSKDTAKILKIILENPKISLIKTIRLNRLDGYRLYVSKVYNLLVKLLFGIKTRDINGWPVLIRQEVYRRMHIGDYGWIVQLEYLYQIKKMNKMFKEVNVRHQRRGGGVSKIRFVTIFHFTVEMLLYRLRTLFQGKNQFRGGYVNFGKNKE